MKITTFHVGMLRFDLSEIYELPQNHPYAGRVVAVPMLCYHLALRGRSVLLDAMAFILAETPLTIRIEGYRPPPTLLEQMERRGIDRQAVDTVVITHAHFDHYGALSVAQDGVFLPAFPQARHYLGQADWQPGNFDAFDQLTLGLVHERGLLTLVEDNLDLGDGISILSAPGETDGHQILRVETAERPLLFVGDLYHHPLEFAHAADNVYWAEAQKMAASKRELMETAADDQAAVYFSHIFGAKRVVRSRQGELVWQPAVLAPGHSGW